MAHRLDALLYPIGRNHIKFRLAHVRGHEIPFLQVEMDGNDIPPGHGYWMGRPRTLTMRSPPVRKVLVIGDVVKSDGSVCQSMRPSVCKVFFVEVWAFSVTVLKEFYAGKVQRPGVPRKRRNPGGRRRPASSTASMLRFSDK